MTQEIITIKVGEMVDGSPAELVEAVKSIVAPTRESIGGFAITTSNVARLDFTGVVVKDLFLYEYCKLLYEAFGGSTMFIALFVIHAGDPFTHGNAFRYRVSRMLMKVSYEHYQEEVQE